MLSFVIPAKDEERSITILYQEIVDQIKKLGCSYEIIFIDDGSVDGTFGTAVKLHQKDPNVKIIKHRGNFGKSIALQSGFDNCRGDIVITMDADLQDDPKEIPNFLKKLNEGYDLVSGWKKKRKDPITKVIPSRIINLAVRILTGVKIHDINCGFKAYKKEVLKDLNIYGDLYRFIPVLADRKKFRITEIAVNHRNRKFGKSKYGWRRFISSFLDLLTIFFLARYLRRPGHFFGTFGIIFLSMGFIVGLYITYLRITTGGIAYRYPFLFLGVLLIILGVQFVMTGLLAEMIIFFQKREDSNDFIKELTA
ncbi:glycosyltransferase [Candidatus Shapirobacteria bacterium CG_4_9_14_0_2_um_filter_39_11]|uniref:Glycosyltransferase n=2 Tax=Patescibacteria group TaxID=1783273 RepID=A0A2M8ESL2_9BACT|nr:MAG: glycosyltransferase [Candidatus Shapirobacteria bacterium CG_4_9_14_0_2_um_filter_39_11]